MASYCFVNHMLEKGVDIKFIKEILGHFNRKTTEKYLHVTRETLINIEALWMPCTAKHNNIKICIGATTTCFCRQTGTKNEIEKC